MLESTDFEILSMETVNRLSDHPREIAKRLIANHEAARTEPICNQHASTGNEVSPALPTDATLKKTYRLTDEELVKMRCIPLICFLCGAGYGVVYLISELF